MRQLHLVGYMLAGPTFHHHGMWRHPLTDPGFLQAEWYQNIARLLEHGKFDMLFFADALLLYDNYNRNFETTLKYGGQCAMQLDPVLLLSMLSASTRFIGLGTTISTTFYPPYHVARSLATLDHISGGRAAWNVVTSFSDAEAQNLGIDKIMDRDTRYERADEFMEVCLKLWESWESDALTLDKESGIFADPMKVHYINYVGQWLKSRGPLTVPHSPQGRPVIMQAGASSKGRDFAAKWGELVFTLQYAPEHMKAFYRDIKSRMTKYGREPEECAILPAVQPIIGETELIAKEKQSFVNELVQPVAGLATMSTHVGYDFSKHNLNELVNDISEHIGTEGGSRGSFDVIVQGTMAEGLTLKEAGKRFGMSELTPQIVGTPSQVADQLEVLFQEEACDGFIITPIYLPGAYEEFVMSVVPELQRRGVFRKEYTGTTLRENLGFKHHGVV